MSSAMAPMWHMIHIRLFRPFFHLLTLAHRSPRAMWPYHLHPVAAALCIFQPNQQTIISNSIFYLSSPKTVGLMSWALLATPRLHCAAGNLQLSSVCVCCMYVSPMCCNHNINMQQHEQCVLATLRHPSISISHSVPSPSISHYFTHLQALSLRARVDSWMAGLLDRWMDGCRGWAIKGGGVRGCWWSSPKTMWGQPARRGGTDKCHSR